MNRSSANRRWPQNAFTLIEVLVVLIMVGLASGILMQGLAQVFGLQTRFGVQLNHAQQDALSINWFRQCVNGLLPDYDDGKNKFSGTARQMSGLSTNPLAPEYGAPGAFAWEIKFNADLGDTELRYGSERFKEPILSWKGNQGKFVYVDVKDEPHEAWPPRLGLWPQLPAAVRLEMLRDGEPYVIFAVPMGTAPPPLRIKDILEQLR